MLSKTSLNAGDLQMKLRSIIVSRKQSMIIRCMKSPVAIAYDSNFRESCRMEVIVHKETNQGAGSCTGEIVKYILLNHW